MTTRNHPNRAQWRKATIYSLLMHAACLTAIIILSKHLVTPPAPQTTDVIFTLHPDIPLPEIESLETNTAITAEAETPSLPPAKIPEPQQPATPQTPIDITPADANEPSLIANLPSFTITSAGEIINDTRQPPAPKITSNTPDTTTITEQDTPEMGTYFAIFTQTLRDAYTIPNTLGDQRSYTVRIRYEVAADGTLGTVTVIRSSGSAAYDASVLAAFRTMRNIGPRPDGRSTTLVADFRI